MTGMHIDPNSGATVGLTSVPRIPIVALGWSLAAFLAVSFTLCAIFAVLFSWDRMFQVWLPLLPGVTALSVTGFFAGLVETLIWGWYIAAVFGPIFNFFSERFAR